MIVKCREDKLENVRNSKTEELLTRIYHRLEGKEENLKKGQCYVVYSLFEPDRSDSFKWYLIKTHADSFFIPHWYPEFFFEVIDPTPANFWMTFWIDGIALSDEKGKIYTFPEFTETDDFYYNLVEGCEREVKMFDEYAKKMKDNAIL